MARIDSLVKDIVNKFIEKDLEISNKDIGNSIILSLVPLDEKYFVLCDGSKYRKTDVRYRKLYEVIGDKFLDNYNKTDGVTKEEFVVPNLIDKGFIMQDKSSTLDTSRELGSNGSWSIPLRMISDFNFFDQTPVILNNPNAPYAEGEETYKFDTAGNQAFVARKYNRFKMIKNGSEELAFDKDNKLRFNSIYVYPYLKYRTYEELNVIEKYS